tara:strand:- start:508 stop:4080 length:3573 start_codon:yes stop_codon:yes gene_type:complete
MTVFFPRPWINEGVQKSTKPVKFDWWKDFKGGFETENLPAIAYQYMLDNSDFTPEENYNPSNDPQLKGYEDFMHLFYFSKSHQETSSIIEKYKKHQELNYSSPWHYLGKITGAALDPSSALFFTKAGSVAKMVGSAMLAEELVKQNLDPMREDSYVPMVAAWGYTLPYVLNKFTASIPIKTQKTIKQLDSDWNGSPNKVYEEGKFIDPNKLDNPPSGVGAEGITYSVGQTVKINNKGGTAKIVGQGFINKTNKKFYNIETNKGNKYKIFEEDLHKLNSSMPIKRMEGEKFVKSHLGVFGENGPWTPVFRVINSQSNSARIIMGDLLDTPLLKLKNTKEWGFQATGKSIETDMRMMRVGEIESHKLVKDQYLNYVKRQQSETGTPVSILGTDAELAIKNKRTPEYYTLDEFSYEVTKARLNKMDHDVPEVAEAARISQKYVYGPLFEQVQQLKIREMPIEQNLKFWTRVYDDLHSKNKGTYKYWSKIENREIEMPISAIESRINKLKKKLIDIPKGGVDNYINIVYVKNAIDKNKEGFKNIIRDYYIRKQIPFNESKLSELVDDLSNHFPFQRFEKTNWKKITKLEEETLAKHYAMKATGQKPGSKLYDEALADINKKILQYKAAGKDIESLYGQLLSKETAHTTYKEALKDIEQQLLREKYIFNHPRYARANRARELNLDEIAQIKLLEDGFIMGDIFALQKIYARQIIPDILLVKKYGDTGGIGHKYISEAESMTSPGLLDVVHEYKLKIFMANSKKDKTKLTKEMFQTLDDLEAAIELIRGTYGLPANPHSYTSVAMRTMKHYNALTMLTGFYAAVTDVARTVTTSGIKRGFKTQFEVFSDFLDDAAIFKAGKKEAQSFGEATDMVTGQRAMLFSDVGDMFGLANKLENSMGKLSAFNFMYVNLMSRWTEFTKSIASVTIGSRIIEDSIKWSKGTLSDKWKTALATSGIDEQIAKRIAKQYELHGEKTTYNFMANTAKWEDDLARDAFGAALNKDINVTIVTPGLGDTPKWMSTELGSTFAQFKKFAMASTQRMLMRGMQEGDLNFMFSVMLLMGSGMLIDATYHKVRFNRDYSKLSLTEKLLNAFDRSGLAGIYTDVNKAIETLSDNRIGISPLLGDQKPYGSSGRWKAGTIGGPTGGQIYNIFDIIYDVTGNKYNHHTAKNVRRLIPFQNIWYLDWLFDDIQKGLH